MALALRTAEQPLSTDFAFLIPAKFTLAALLLLFSSEQPLGCGKSAILISASPSAPIIARKLNPGVVPTCVRPPEGGRSDLASSRASHVQEDYTS